MKVRVKVRVRVHKCSGFHPCRHQSRFMGDIPRGLCARIGSSRGERAVGISRVIVKLLWPCYVRAVRLPKRRGTDKCATGTLVYQTSSFQCIVLNVLTISI